MRAALACSFSPCQIRLHLADAAVLALTADDLFSLANTLGFFKSPPAVGQPRGVGLPDIQHQLVRLHLSAICSYLVLLVVLVLPAVL